MRRVLHVDLGAAVGAADAGFGTGTAHTRVEEIDVSAIAGLSGKALAVDLLERYLDPTAAPLSAGNVVVLTSSPLAAYAFSGSNRLGAFCRSPLTGAFLESYVGGNAGRALREAGWDAVIVHGAAAAPTRLHLDATGAGLFPAADLWGRDSFATDDALTAVLDKRSVALVIGPGGETQNVVASVQAEKDHALGRGGLGAVFGSKRLKAVTITSPGALRLTPRDGFDEMRKRVSQLATDSPAANAYRRMGTPMMVALLNEAGGFPAGYWTAGTVAHRATLEAEHYPEWATVQTGTCPPCPMRCRRHLTLTEGPQAGREIHGPEYETLYSFGGLCMVEHARDVLLLHEECNRLGIDTISAGNLVALAIEARRQGRVDGAPAPGDVVAIAALLSDMARRSTPLGDTLAAGIREAADSFGMADQAIHVKGMEPAGYDPRALRGMALAYATSPRGACHLRATFYKPILGGLTKDLDADGIAALFIDFEDRLFLFDCLVMCRFYRDFLTWDDLVVAANTLAAETADPGTAAVEIDQAGLQRLARDLLTRVRRLNFAFGLTAADDTLPRRFFTEPLGDKPPLGDDEFDGMLTAYYVARGWGAAGVPTPVRRSVP
jgi:aldehyde:ferredoxin oxidoreductase